MLITELHTMFDADHRNHFFPLPSVTYHFLRPRLDLAFYPMSYGSTAMGNAEKYRANAEHCLRMANEALNPHDEQTWLNMAETWLGMIPESQRFEKAVRKHGTRQELCKSRH
jgi:hypothetical protein